MGRLMKMGATNLHRSWVNLPHVTQFDEADITELEAFRKSMKAEAEAQGAKLTPLPFLIKACAFALRKFPQFNVSLKSDGETVVHKKYVHIGIAVDTPDGLMVPVIRDADQKSLIELAKESVELAGKAQSKKLKREEMTGGCFTISSLGPSAAPPSRRSSMPRKWPSSASPSPRPSRYGTVRPSSRV